MMWPLLRRLVGGLTLVLTLLLITVPMVRAATIVDVTAGDEPRAFTFKGAGFDSTEKVRFAINGPNEAYTVLSERTTNSEGSIEFSQIMPRYLQAGAWTITLLGEDSRLESSANFVLPSVLPNAEVGLSQTTGPNGTDIRVTSRDFEHGEQVNYWMTGPDGKIYASGQNTTDTNKSMRFNAMLETGSIKGLWKISVYGTDSDRLAIAEFVIG